MIGGRRRWATPGTRFIAWSAGAVLALMLGGSAVASGDGLSIKVPRSVPTGGEMHQTATGFAAGPRLLVVYITDKKPCASTAKKEEKRHTPRGSVRGERLAVQVNH